MAQASRDQNNVPTLLGVSTADGKTPVTVYADPSTHRLLVNNSATNPVTDGTYTVGAKLTEMGTEGTITIENGVITAIQEAT